MLRAKGFDGKFGSEVADGMNKFFEQNPDLAKENIHHLQVKLGRAYNAKTQEVDTFVTALMVYDETKLDKATRGTQ